MIAAAVTAMNSAESNRRMIAVRRTATIQPGFNYANVPIVPRDDDFREDDPREDIILTVLPGVGYTPDDGRTGRIEVFDQEDAKSIQVQSETLTAGWQPEEVTVNIRDAYTGTPVSGRTLSVDQVTGPIVVLGWV